MTANFSYQTTLWKFSSGSCPGRVVRLLCLFVAKSGQCPLLVYLHHYHQHFTYSLWPLSTTAYASLISLFPYFFSNTDHHPHFAHHILSLRTLTNTLNWINFTSICCLFCAPLFLLCNIKWYFLTHFWHQLFLFIESEHTLISRVKRSERLYS